MSRVCRFFLLGMIRVKYVCKPGVGMYLVKKGQYNVNVVCERPLIHYLRQESIGNFLTFFTIIISKHNPVNHA